MPNMQTLRYFRALNNDYKIIVDELNVGNKSQNAKRKLIDAVNFTLKKNSNNMNADEKKIVKPYLDKLLNLSRNHPKLKNDPMFQEQLKVIFELYKFHDTPKPPKPTLRNAPGSFNSTTFFAEDPKTQPVEVMPAPYVPDNWEELAHEQLRP